MKIRPIIQSDIQGLNRLPPPEWKFDYSMFLHDHLDANYFSGFVMQEDGIVIGTGNVLLKDKIGWLANIIVVEQERGRGLGKEMTQYLVDYLNNQGCETQLLIATDLGEPVYHKVGFTKVTTYESFDSFEDTHSVYPSQMRKLNLTDRGNVVQLDLMINAEDRSHLIEKFYSNSHGWFDNNGILLGCYLPDFGRGLVISTDTQVGIELLSLKHSQAGRRTLVPRENRVAINHLQSLGLKQSKPSSRMYMGKALNWNPQHIYSYASGYCG